MDHWPTSTTNQASLTKKGRRKRNAKSQETTEVPRPYPLIEQGSVSAANLQYYGKGVDWNFLARNDSGHRLVARNTPVKIFPATSSRSTRPSTVSVTRKAEQGAQFLRTHYPDIDIASDLIRDELTEEAKRTADLRDLDAYAGNKLATVFIPERTRKRSIYLAFPMGPLGCDLNLSPLIYSKRDHVTFKPFATPAYVFETPIEQIVAHTSENSDSAQGAFLAVRTSGSTEILTVCMQDSLTYSVTAEKTATYTRSATGEKQTTDIIFPAIYSTQYPQALVVNEAGNVFSCQSDSKQLSDLVYQQPPDATSDTFWRVADTFQDKTALLMSSGSLALLDFRGKTEKLDMLARPLHDAFTAVEGPSIDKLIRVVTTSEIIWVDQRFPQKPVVGYRHGRKYDRTLQIQTMAFTGSPLSLLTSAKNELVTIYDVSSENGKPVAMHTPAYSIPPVNLDGARCAGHTLLRHPLDRDDGVASLIRLSERGSIHRLDLEVREIGSQGSYSGTTHTWSRDVERLEEATSSLPSEMGPLSGRAYSEVDLEPAYSKLFIEEAEVEEDADRVYDTIDSMQSFWNDLDAPVDNMLTKFDIAFRAGNEPVHSSRADFFTEGAVNSTRGYRALVQGRLSHKSLPGQAAWHHNFSSALHKFVPEVHDEPQKIFDALERYNLEMDDYRTGPSIRREKEAREQVTLDLALATDIYSPHAITRASSSGSHDSLEDEAFETMSRATEAMTIGVSEPPPVHFGFLRPDFGKAIHYRTDEGGEETNNNCPLGVRLLLKEWDVGADPAQYTYEDPYDTTGARAAMPPPTAHLRGTQNTFPQTQPSQRMPPTIVPVAAAAPPRIAASQPSRGPPTTHAQSQDVVPSIRADHQIGSQPTPHFNVESNSQDLLMTNTQVMPGPFGGRPAVAKKKPVKKRLGGF